MAYPYQISAVDNLPNPTAGRYAGRFGAAENGAGGAADLLSDLRGKLMIENWQTSIPGLAMIICAVLLFIYGPSTESTIAAGALVAGGVGLLKAQDARRGPARPRPQDPPRR